MATAIWADVSGTAAPEFCRNDLQSVDATEDKVAVCSPTESGSVGGIIMSPGDATAPHLSVTAIRQHRFLKQQWAGALSHLRRRYTSVELQHDLLDWRAD